jgi:tetratricopeptide (TPR) repeat protein
MSSLKKTIAITLTAALLAVATGCDSYAQKKDAAHTRWEKTTAIAKMPVARELFVNERYDEAQATLDECIRVAPEMTEAHLLLGKVLYTQGKLPEAAGAFATTVKLDDTAHEAWYMLGLITQKRDVNQAQKYFRMAMDAKPTSSDYIIALAGTYAQLGQQQKALDMLSQKSKQMPGNAELSIAQADILMEMGDLDAAIKFYDRSMLVSGTDKETMAVLGYCYVMANRWSEAGRIFEKLAADSTGDTRTSHLKLLAMCSMNGAEYGKAVDYYDQLSLNNRNDAELWLKMGQAALGAEAPNRAATCAIRALDLRPAWPDAIALRGCTHYLKKDYNAAIKTFQRITSDGKVGPFAWMMTARCYQQLGQRARADKAYESARNLDPENKLLAFLTE